MNNIFNNYDSENDERLDKKFSYNYQVIKNVYPKVSELPEDEVREIIRKYYDATGTHEDSMQAVMDYIHEKEPEWKRLYFKDETLDNGSRIQPMTESQKKEAEALARQIRPEMPNMFTDYLAQDTADMVYGADRAMSGYSLGGYDWLKRKTGIGMDKEEYLKMKEYNEGTRTAAEAGGIISELGGGLKGLSNVVYNGVKGGAKTIGKYVPQWLKGSDLINEIPAIVGSGAIGSGIYSGFQNDFSSWEKIGKDMGYGAGTSAVLYPFLRGGSMAADYMKHHLAARVNGRYREYMTGHAADEVMDFAPTREQIINYPAESRFNLPKQPLTKDKAERVLYDRANDGGVEIGGDIHHYLGKGDREQYVRTLLNTLNNADIKYSQKVTNSKGEEVVRDYWVKKYQGISEKGEEPFFDFIIKEKGKLYNKFVPNSLNYIDNQLRKVPQDVSLTGRLMSAEPTRSHLINHINDIPLKSVVVNSGLPKISSIYEGLSPYQSQALGEAIAEGLSKSIQKAGSLESMDKIRQELNNMMINSGPNVNREALKPVIHQIEEAIKQSQPVIPAMDNSAAQYGEYIGKMMKEYYPYMSTYLSSIWPSVVNE